MNKPKWTPGPLVVVTDGPSKHTTEIRQSNGGAWVGEARTQDDARLFAAAPELFNSLTHMTTILVCRLGEGLNQDEVKQLQHALDLIMRLESK